MTAPVPGIDPSVAPSGHGCAQCEAGDGPGWWFHLRRCAQCGTVSCCESSPSQHASAHFATTGHPVVRSFEPEEGWFWDYREQSYVDGPALAPPEAHPSSQPAPGPEGTVPANWQRQLHR